MIIRKEKNVYYLILDSGKVIEILEDDLPAVRQGVYLIANLAMQSSIESLNLKT